jgi:hypothetical protein
VGCDPDSYVVLRLVGGDVEGKWYDVPYHERPFALHVGIERPVVVRQITMVPTGAFEQNCSGRSAEVYVPEGLLPYWRAEFGP